jgi:hypothetical protein
VRGYYVVICKDDVWDKEIRNIQAVVWQEDAGISNLYEVRISMIEHKKK